MKKVLVVSFCYKVWGHKRQEQEYIENLSSFSDVTVLCPEQWYDKFSDNIHIITYDLRDCDFLGERKEYLNSLKIIYKAAEIEKKNNYEYIFVSVYETYSFSIGRLLFRNPQKLYLLQHNNIDKLTVKKNRFFFNTFARKVNHIVFEIFIAEFLINNLKIDKNHVHILPHQLNFNAVAKVEKKYDCVGLCNTNDESIIDMLYEKEVTNEYFKQKKIRLVLRSKTLEYKGECLSIIKEYLPDEVYNNYINGAKIIYLPLPLNYEYRMSGSLIDALSNGAFVIGTDVPILKVYAQRYPNICYIVRDSEEFLCKLNDALILKSQISFKEFEQFRYDHSREIIIKYLKSIFR